MHLHVLICHFKMVDNCTANCFVNCNAVSGLDLNNTLVIGICLLRAISTIWPSIGRFSFVCSETEPWCNNKAIRIATDAITATKGLQRIVKAEINCRLKRRIYKLRPASNCLIFRSATNHSFIQRAFYFVH